MAGLGPDLERRATAAAEQELDGVSLTLPPAVIATRAMRAAEHLWQGRDPFLEMKIRTTEEALALYEAVKPDALARMAGMTAAERICYSAKLAAAGNIIDFGVGTEFDLEGTLAETLKAPLATDESERFSEALGTAESLLVVSDNAGEIVFDRFLIDEALTIGKRVYLSVKSGPVINDAMRDDVVRAGIAEPVRVIETGSSSLGIVLDECSEEFHRIFREAGVVLSKGQANYETLDVSPRSVFFILRAKCPIVACELGVAAGASVLSWNGKE
jgi:uncharacterized protein with ATP-grasp and redox domains